MDWLGLKKRLEKGDFEGIRGGRCAEIFLDFTGFVRWGWFLGPKKGVRMIESEGEKKGPPHIRPLGFSWDGWDVGMVGRGE